MSTAPFVLILLGPPGAGKGTHASLLSKRLGIPHISSGDLFRENIRKQTEIGTKAQALIEKGLLVPDDVVLKMLENRIKEPDCSNGFILDGVPRTLIQAEELNHILKPKYEIEIISFKISSELLLERITGRLMCKNCGKPYHRQFSPPKKAGICDECSGPLYQRTDDTASVVEKRISVYEELTAPVIQFYHQQLIEIDASNDVESIFKAIIEKLHL
jgi:adenylate kinase